MSLPDRRHRPPSFRIYPIPAATPLIRVYNHAAATAGGYSSTSFNPTSWPSSRRAARKGGRFDSTNRDRFSYLYAAETNAGPTVAIWETLAYKGILRSDGYQYIPGSIFDDYSVRYLEVRRDLEAVDLTDNAAMSFFAGKSDDITESNDYYETREWARYIRSHTAGCSAFCYIPHRLGTSRYGYSFVFFGDRCPSRTVVAKGRPIKLASRTGRALVDAALVDSTVRVEW